MLYFGLNLAKTVIIILWFKICLITLFFLSLPQNKSRWILQKT